MCQISIHALLAESDREPTALRTPHHNFYPRSPCGERPSKKYPVILGRGISIHALLAESDNGGMRDAENLTISIHALLAESDEIKKLFLCLFGYFYPRSPCGERHSLLTNVVSSTDFYPRSPCGERLFDAMQIVIVIIFLSTLSLRRATPGKIWSTAFAA